MRNIRRFIPAFALIALVSSAWSQEDATAASCPLNELQFRGETAFTSDAAAYDTTRAEGFGTFRVAYDLVAGTLHLYHCCSLGVTSVRASDLYDVSGVAPGTVVEAQAVFMVDSEVFDAGGCGGSGCGGWIEMSMEQGTVRDERLHAPILFNGARATFHDELRIPVTFTAGVPVEIAYQFRGSRSPGGSHGAEAFGTFYFAGLAQGVSVRSCQGFNGTLTPARSTSWGRLKTTYR